MTESFGQLWTYSGIITMNEECVIQSVDRACCSIFGYPLEAMLGQNIKLLIPAPYREQHDSYVSNYLRTGERHILGQSRLVEGLTAQNQIFPLRLNVNEVFVDSKRVFVGVVDRLEEMHGRIKATEDGTIVSVNPGLERIFGYNPSELIGQNVSMLMPEPIRSQHDGYMHQWRETHHRYLMELNTLQAAGDTITILPPDYRVLGKIRNLPGMRKNGDIIPISLSVSVLETNGDQPWLHAIIETTDAWVVFTVDDGGIILAATESYSRSIAGRSAEDLRGTHISTILSHLEDAEDDIYFWKKYGIMRLRHSDGSIIPVDVESWAFVDAHSKVAHSLMIRRRPMSESELISTGPPSSLSHSASHSSSDAVVSDNFTFLSGGYVLGKKIGRGSSGAVRLAFHPDTNQTIAVKIYDRTRRRSTDNSLRIEAEIEALRVLIHPHITKLLDSVITASRMYLLMEYHRGGELGIFLQQFPHGTVPWTVARRIISQLVSAVAYCHSHNIVHRDISLQNIMMDSRLNIKLVDFGLCAHIDHATLRSTFCGTPKFASPE
ncbi:MAG: PAS domain S-box protein, partial [archaeon]|nr:PAS domain S-box protein [archaeon]